jgi:hypothetical protein
VSGPPYPLDELTRDLLAQVAPAPDVAAIERQIVLLSDAIDALLAAPGPRDQALVDRRCAQFQALQWARAPDAYASPLPDPVAERLRRDELRAAPVVSLAAFRAARPPREG